MAEIILSALVVVLSATCLRLWDRCRHCERVMLEMAANALARSEDRTGGRAEFLRTT